MNKSAAKIMAGLMLIAFVTALVFCLASPSVQHQIHWIRYGYDRVWYHNRDYVSPSEYTAQEVELQFGQGQKLIPTGDKVIGLPVYDTPRSLAIQKQRHVVSTSLLLKKPNGDFIVYALSGGP
jgi:hypothetical protein